MDEAVTDSAVAAGAQASGVVGPSETSRAGRLREFFSMRSRLASARGAAFAPGDGGYWLFELGLRAFQDAQQLGGSRAGEGTALLLYRSAIRLFVRAWLLRCGEITSHEAPWPSVSDRLGAVPGWHDATQGVEWAERGVMSEDGEAYFAALPGSQRARALADLRAL